MEGKKESKMSLGIVICTLIIILLLIIIGIMYYYYNYDKVNEKITNVSINNSVIKGNLNNIISNNIIQNSNTKTQDIKKLKESLADENWLKENVYLKEDVFGEEIKSSEERKITFAVLNIDNNKAPIVIVQTIIEDKLSVQSFIVSCLNQIIKCEPIAESTCHIGHIAFQVSTNKVSMEYAHMGEYDYDVYDISYTGKNLIDSGEGEIQNADEGYMALDNIDQKYNLSPIDIKLTSDNIEKHIK